DSRNMDAARRLIRALAVQYDAGIRQGSSERQWGPRAPAGITGFLSRAAFGAPTRSLGSLGRKRSSIAGTFPAIPPGVHDGIHVRDRDPVTGRVTRARVRVRKRLSDRRQRLFHSAAERAVFLECVRIRPVGSAALLSCAGPVFARFDRQESERRVLYWARNHGGDYRMCAD